MANSNPPKKNQAFTVRIFLDDMAVQGSFKANPTIAAGDFKVDIDGAGYNDLSTLPTVSPAGSVSVLVSLSSSEMNGNQITLTAIDQTVPKEWADYGVCIETTA